MTSSIENPVERGLDTMLIVFSLPAGHPASPVCEQFLRTRAGWFTTTFTLFEVKAVLTKVYGVEQTQVTRKLEQFAMGPLQIVGMDAIATLTALHLADTFLSLEMPGTVPAE